MYEKENESPNIHLIKLKAEDGYFVYLPTEEYCEGIDSEGQSNVVDDNDLPEIVYDVCV